MRKTGAGAAIPSFLDNSNIFPAFITNFQGELISANKVFTQLFAESAISELAIGDIITKDSAANFFYNRSAILGGSPLHAQSSLSTCKVEWEISLYNKTYFICTGSVTEITAGKSEINNPFSVFFNNSPALMWATDKEGRLQMMNKRYQEHTGFTDRYIGAQLWDIYPKEMADQFKANDDIVLASNGPIEIEEVSVDKAGNRRNYLAYKFPLETGEHGTMVAGCSIDITDILEKTKQLNFQSHLLDSIEQAVYILDADSKITYWSKYAEVMFGWSKDEILNKDVAVLMAGGVIDQTLSKNLQDKQSWHGELDLVKKDGSLVSVHISKSPVLDDNNDIVAFIGISKDISERKIAHKRLVKQNNQFRQIARLQSHAVRRPLANILGLIDLIQYYSNKNEPGEVLNMIELLRQSSEDLDDIIRRIVLKAGVYFDPELRIA